MLEKNKNNLLELLSKNHLDLMAELNEIDLDTPVHKESGWRVRDIIGHIATWNQETARSINAFRLGSEYSIPDLDDSEVAYNEKAVVIQKKLSNQQVLDELESAYHELSKAVQELPVDVFAGSMLYPWGNETGSVIRLVEYMVQHVVEHRDEIVRAIKA